MRDKTRKLLEKYDCAYVNVAMPLLPARVYLTADLLIFVGIEEEKKSGLATLQQR
jgi:hypothetical protein